MTADDFIAKLALGTAQFGLAYGINNTQGRPDDATVADILTEARTAGITLLDSAAAYGDSEARLGQWLSTQPNAFRVVSKVSAAAPAEVRSAIQASVGRLRIPQLYGLLFHDFGALQRHPEAWQALQEAQSDGVAQRIGVSLYHPWQAAWLLDAGLKPGLLQVPFNVLDQRFGPLLPELAAQGIEVHVRSAFLQGLLLRPLETLPAYFEPLRPKLARLRALVHQADVPLEAALLLFAASVRGVSRVVIGVDSADNLRSNVAAADWAAQLLPLREELAELAETTDTFILPYTWPGTT